MSMANLMHILTAEEGELEANGKALESSDELSGEPLRA